MSRAAGPGGPAITILVSVFAMAVGVQSTRLARESRTWPTVDGEILRSEIVEDVDRQRPGRTSVTYRPVVQYRYRVGDLDYTGERVAVGEFATNDRADAEAVLRRYPVGRRLPVHVPPEAPGTAVLEPGDQGLPWFYLAIGTLFLIVGVLLGWLAPKLIAPA